MKVKIYGHLEVIEWEDINGVFNPLVQQSSAIANDGKTDSYLRFGKHHLHLDDVKRLVKHLQAWVKTGSLRTTKPKKV